MISQIELAGTIYQIESEYGEIDCFCNEFVVKKELPDCEIYVDQRDLDYEWLKAHGAEGNNDSLSCKSMKPILERKAILRKINEKLPDFCTIMMHGAVVSDGSNAIMFTAPSGEGKTTRAKLLIECMPGLFILNGDKPFIRLQNNDVFVYSSPWKGKEGDGVNTSASLKSVFLLERSDHIEISEQTMDESFGFLASQTCMPEQTVNALKTIQLIRELYGKVKIFKFKAPPTREAVMKAWDLSIKA